MTAPVPDCVHYDDLPSVFSKLFQRGGAICGLDAIESMVSAPGMSYVGFDTVIPAIEGMYDGRCLGTMIGTGEWKTIVSGHKKCILICMDTYICFAGLLAVNFVPKAESELVVSTLILHFKGF